MRSQFWGVTGFLAIATIFAVSPLSAQVENSLSAYTGKNAKGYLQPLADAIGAGLNNGFYYSARIPSNGIRVSLEFPVTGIIFRDEDRTFSAVTEGGFNPTTTTTNAATIVGGGSVTVQGSGGSQYSFPGGLNLNSFGLVVPQLRVGAFRGTEGVLRLVAGVDVGDSELGKVSLLGLGLRHNISQWFESPVDVAAGFLWQSFKVGENDRGGDLMSTHALTISAQASRNFPMGFTTFVPYTGLSFDNYSMDVEYDDGNSSLTKVAFDNSSTMHWTVGIGFNLVAAQVWAQYDLASTKAFGFGLALGNLGL